MDLTAGSDVRCFFMKRFISPHFKDIIFAWRNFGKLCSQASLEWQNAGFLLQHGIRTYRPACFGEKIVMGMERASFFLTEEIKGLCLPHLVSKRWHSFGKCEREQLMTSLGRFVKKIHDVGISMPDLYLWHIYAIDPADAPPGTDYELAVIDLHRMRRNASSPVERARNLAAFSYSLSEKYFDARCRELFLDAYMEGIAPPLREKIARTLEQRTRVIIKRRGQPRY